MPLNRGRARPLLAECNLRRLFVEELGWDNYSAQLKIQVWGDATYALDALAQKRGMVAYQCPTPAGRRLPEYAVRRKVEHQVARHALEHLIIFTDVGCETQIWQWVKREPGRPAACREHVYCRTQPGDALLQKLESIAFTLEEEDHLALPDVTRRARVGFDVERVTRRFYERFQKEHTEFLKFISGIVEPADQEWYASVMLNRLMFIYFIQRKGFLDNDPSYLRNRLRRMHAEYGRDKFYSFYRYFLLRLFHEGLGSRERSPDLEELLGRIPFLNGGLFDIHELERPERYGRAIEIPDGAFERIFDFFDQYQWHLDERPLRSDKEINPDVLGYIFEKYVNQKQMGAYYTQEDITEYISKNTVLPIILDRARSRCRVAFENAKGPTVWDLLKDDPDRYIFPAVRYGIREPFPENIAAGLNPPTLHRIVDGDGPVHTLELRRGWNKPAPESHALPTETWREIIARRTRYMEVRARLAAGAVRDIHDLVTLNLDIRQFAQDVVENCEGPDLLRAVWHAIENVSILDPTCGSGAFLFAALNILEPLYEACLERMEAFVEDLDRYGEKRRPEKFSDFRRVLARVTAHPNRSYFVLKSIILNNLYGVDIMEEAVEICKLRLFLKLAAQVDPDATHGNLGIDPLPDVDFNIRAGNTLVGYATYDEVKQAVTSKLDFDQAMHKIATTAADLQQAFDSFRARQVEGDDSVPYEDKQELRLRLALLDEELNRYLAGEYGVNPSDKEAYAGWKRSHQPFHWFVEFYGIIHEAGGFDVVVGNPPWVEYATVRKRYTVRGYSTEACGNLHGLCTERGLAIRSSKGTMSFIVQLPLTNSTRMASVRQALTRASSLLCLIPCDDRPGKLFEGLEHCRAVIWLSFGPGDERSSQVFTTRYQRWLSVARRSLFQLLDYAASPTDLIFPGLYPKTGSILHSQILGKIRTRATGSVTAWLAHHRTKAFVFYQESTGYWVKATVGLPYYAKNGRVGAPAHGRYFYLPTIGAAVSTCALLHSSLFYSYFIAYSDCFHLSDGLVRGFPINPDLEDDTCLTQGGEELMSALKRGSARTEIRTKAGDRIAYDEYYGWKAKVVIDGIDGILARAFHFTEEELDFIINYDIKYRMGGDADGEKEATE